MKRKPDSRMSEQFWWDIFHSITKLILNLSNFSILFLKEWIVRTILWIAYELNNLPFSIRSTFSRVLYLAKKKMNRCSHPIFFYGFPAGIFTSGLRLTIMFDNDFFLLLSFSVKTIVYVQWRRLIIIIEINEKKRNKSSEYTV